MVWGCISCEGTGLITKMEGRMNGTDYSRLLSIHLLPYMQSSYVFMDDNAPCGGFLSVSKLLAGTVDMCVYHSTYVTFALWPLALAS